MGKYKKSSKYNKFIISALRWNEEFELLDRSYSVSDIQPRDRIFVKGYGFLSFVKNIGKKNWQKYKSKLIQKCLDHAKESAKVALKISSTIVILKTAESTGYLIGNKIADRITKVPRSSPQNNSETVMIKKNLKKKIYISRRST